MDPLDLFLEEELPEAPKEAAPAAEGDDILVDLLEEFRTAKDPKVAREAFEVILDLYK